MEGAAVPNIASTVRQTPGGDLAAIQYLRGYAALSVVVYHLMLQWNGLGGPEAWPTLKSGVDVFFVISGFIMQYSTRGGTRYSPLEFLARRLGRIAPLYWGMTLLVIAIIGIRPELVRTTGTNLVHAIGSFLFVPLVNPALLTRMPVVLPGWTLQYEMFFYVCFAAAIALGKRRPERVLPILVIGLVSFVVLAPWLPIPPLIAYFASPYLLEFVLGVLVATVLEGRQTDSTAIVSVAALVLVAVLILPPDQPDSWRLVRYGLASTGLVACAAVSRATKLRLMHMLGDISYSLYLTHFVVHPVYTRLWRLTGIGEGWAGEAVFMTGGVVLSIVVAYLCWKWFERPASRAVTATLVRFCSGGMRSAKSNGSPLEEGSRSI